MKSGSKPGERMVKAEESVIIAFFAAFSTCFFTPFDFFISNITDIMLPVKAVIILLAVVSAAVFGAVFCLCFFTKGKANFICTTLVFAISLGFYIQSSFLSIGMNELDGTQYLAGTGKIILNAVFWAGLIAAAFVIRKKIPEMYGKISSHLSAAVCVIEIVTLVISFMAVILEDDGGNVLTLVIEGGSRYVCSMRDWELYSSEENTIIILTDEYDSFAFDAAAEICPEALSGFDGFTYYTNTLGMYGSTSSSMAYISTGNRGGVELPYENDRFFDRMAQCCKMDIYSVSGIFGDNIYEKYADNYLEMKISIKDMEAMGKVLYRITMFKCAPELFKGFFWMYSDSFTQMFEGADSVKAYYPDDLSFYNSISPKLSLTEERRFKFFYLYGLHDPRNITADLKRAENWSISAEEQAVAMNKILSYYFDALKDGGVYDNSRILLLADHGIKSHNNGKYPLLMYKPAGNPEQEGIRVSNAPISYADLYPTLLLLAGDEPEERTIFDIGENEVRERYFGGTDEYITGNIKE